MHTRHLLKLVAAAVGQVILLAFAWGFVAAVLLHDPLVLPLHVAELMILHPSEVMLVVTVIATVLSVATMFCFSTALKEALQHRVYRPISLFDLTSGIAIARGDYFFGLHLHLSRYSSSRYLGHRLFTTSVAIFVFVLTKLMVSCWATLLFPIPITFNTTCTGSELDLNSNHFESQLRNQILSTGGGISAQSNSVEIVDTDSLLSGISTAQYGFGVHGIQDFNGVLYNGSTGGVLPAIPGYNGSDQPVPSNNTGLSFVGGSVLASLPCPAPAARAVATPQSRTLAATGTSNFTVVQQGLTADVTCSLAPDLEVQTLCSPPVSTSAANNSELTAWTFTLSCAQGNSSQQTYAIRTSDGNPISTVGLMASLVCPYPVGQSQLDWTQFNVTSYGYQKYQFLQATTCQITPRLTTSLVTYAGGTLNAVVVNSTQLTSSNANLALFLASVIDYQSGNTQSLVSNSLGDALYSIVMSTDNSSTDLIAELEQYWRGVIELSGTYLRSGFSAIPNSAREGLADIGGVQTITTMGWNMRSPLFLYTVLPVTFLAFLTCTAFIYSVCKMRENRRNEDDNGKKGENDKENKKNGKNDNKNDNRNGKDGHKDHKDHKKNDKDDEKDEKDDNKDDHTDHKKNDEDDNEDDKHDDKHDRKNDKHDKKKDGKHDKGDGKHDKREGKDEKKDGKHEKRDGKHDKKNGKHEKKDEKDEKRDGRDDQEDGKDDKKGGKDDKEDGKDDKKKDRKDDKKKAHKKFAAFDPSNPIHLIMVLSTREFREEARNLEGEGLGDFSDGGIERNEDVLVKVVNVGSGGMRKRFKHVKTADDEESVARLRDVGVRDNDVQRNSV